MIVKKIWFNQKYKERHLKKLVEMHGWFLFGIIPIYVIEYRTIN